ncbi:MAG: hypothetical protein HYV37_02505 [Candidatus Levyibacteriota bacterium]|nr:MAG: hypothetical protein HYV37_02505 [Candidatus Levybacteria bacterium]
MARIKFSFIFPLLFSIAFFVIPFFWFAPGEMDLGGDASRLYFYDPIHYLSQSLYSISYGAFGIENASYYASIPLFLLLILLKFILRSPTLLIEVFHGLSLSVAFLACYFIIKDLLHQEGDKGRFGRNIIEASAILAGVFYNLSPVPILNWDHILLIGNVVFLNPLIFFLLLRFFLFRNMNYMLGALLLSFIFASNFSLAGAPPFFSFYPIVVLFLILYTKFVVKKPIPVKKIIVSAILFFLIHAFQLGPQIIGLLTPGNVINTTVFSEASIQERGLSYFTAVAPSIKTSLNLLALPQQQAKLDWYAFFFILFPLLLVLGFIWNKKKGYLLSGIFFLIVLFFASANITKVGFTLYIALFQIPGFSMFRNFYGQWFRSYDFFYMLLFGQAMAIVLSSLDKKFYRYLLGSLIFILLLTTSWPMINGELVNTNLWQSKNIKSHIEMDPQYEKVLEFIRTLPVDGRVLTLPMTNYGYQVLQGKNGGAYMGPSTITYLTQKSEFTAPGDFGAFDSVFLKAVRDKHFSAVKNMLAVFNVKYIFYNSDPYIYGDNFPAFPYEHVLKYLPPTQEEYKAFIKNLDVEEIADFGDKYHIYSLKDTDYLPHIYAAKEAYYADQLAKEALLPLFFDLPEKRIALYNKNMDSQNIGRYDKIFLEAKIKSLYADAAKKKNYQPIDYPGIAERLSSPLRFLTGLSQGYKSNKIDDASIDNATKKAESIIDNLRNKGEQLSVLVDSAVITNLNYEPDDLNQIFSTNALIDGSWNLELYHYITEMLDVIDKIKKPNNSLYPLWTNKESMNYILNVDEINSDRITASLTTKTDQDKMFLHLLENKIFDYLRKRLDFNLPGNLETNYIVDVPENGIYEVYRYKDPLDDLKETTQSLLSIDSKILSVNKLQSQQSWLRFNDFYINAAKDLTIKSPLISNNLMKDEVWQSLDGHIINNNNATFLLNDVLGDNQGLFRQIVPFRPSTYYVISFDYNTLGKNFWIQFYTLSGKERNQANLIKSESLRSYDWKTYRSVIQSSDDPNTASLIQIMLRDQCLSNCPMDKVEMKNFEVVEVPQPRIVLKKNNAIDSQEKILPQITFTKINPTKYQIKIRNAADPYTLVFQGAYNKDWKLFRESGEMSEDENASYTSYFNGEIKEGNHTSIFLSPQTFDTWGKQTVADKKHFLVNGYANGWNIDPNDMDGKTDYALILEFNTQRIFYGFLLISVITFIGCIILLCYNSYKKNV